MMKSVAKHLFVFLMIICLSFLLFATPAHAQQTAEWTGVCTDVDKVYGGAGANPSTGVATFLGLQCLIGNVLQIAVSGIGLAGFVMMIIGAFQYMLSGGNAKGVDDGQKTMTFAVIGLVVALCAFVILKFISDFTGVESIVNFKFNLPSYTSPNDIPRPT